MYLVHSSVLPYFYFRSFIKIFLQRIQIAIALIEEGSKAVATMFSSLLFPIVPYLFQLVSKVVNTEPQGRLTEGVLGRLLSSGSWPWLSS